MDDSGSADADGQFLIELIPVSRIDAEWRTLHGLLAPCIEKMHTQTAGELLIGCRTGTWLAYRGGYAGQPAIMAAVVSLEQHQGADVANVLSWGGKSPVRRWARPSWEAFGKELERLGVSDIYIAAHRGLERFLPVKPVQFIYRGKIGASHGR